MRFGKIQMQPLSLFKGKKDAFKQYVLINLTLIRRIFDVHVWLLESWNLKKKIIKKINYK